MSIGSFLFGSNDKFQKLPTMSNEQSQLFSQIIGLLRGQSGQGFQQGTQHLQQLLDPSSEAYSKFQQPYMDQFNQQTVPQLAERFAGLGGGLGGGTSSSGFGQSLSSAGANLQNQLASLKTGMQSQAANSLMQQFQQLLGQGLGKDTFAYGHQQANPGFLSQVIGQALGGAGQGFGFGAGQKYGGF